MHLGFTGCYMSGLEVFLHADCPSFYYFLLVSHHSSTLKHAAALMLLCPCCKQLTCVCFLVRIQLNYIRKMVSSSLMTYQIRISYLYWRIGIGVSVSVMNHSFNLKEMGLIGLKFSCISRKTLSELWFLLCCTPNKLQSSKVSCNL